MQLNRFLKISILFIFFIGLLYFTINAGRQELGDDLPKVIYGIKKMILVPGGTFYMDETPITYADFQKYVEAGGAKPKYWEYETYNQPEHPVTGLNWHHAVDYCNWRSKVEGFPPAYKPTGKLDAWGYSIWELDGSAGGYRLPTEAEFEYAARGGLMGKAFPWGDKFNSLLANFDDERGVMKGEWWRLSKVKDQKPNGYGLYGMSGNIWHFCNDWYDPDRTKFLKGGSWGSISPAYLRVDKGSYTAPGNYNYDIGFRCVRPASEQIIKITHEITHEFYQYKTSNYENPIQIDLDSEEFINRLSQFIADYYPNCIYFQTEIDEQKIISPKEMAGLIVEITEEYHIHPLFLTGVMAAESGFGGCSFPRWYNNPMAYHWQNALMEKGLPTYEPSPNRNRKYKNLKSGFIAFAEGIRQDIYFKAAKDNLDTFHLIYVGYRADEWMYTISKIYKDVLGVRLESNSPTKDVGKLIYTDWETIDKIKE